VICQGLKHGGMKCFGQQLLDCAKKITYERATLIGKYDHV